MPITPLHFGLLPLLNRATKRAISVGGFILANVVADIPVIAAIVEQEKTRFGAPSIDHAIHDVFTHNFVGALALGVVLGLLAVKKRGWLLGCVLGALTHVGLDMFCHSDVAPFAPLNQWNPFYFEYGHAWVSMLMVVGLAWLMLDLIDKRRGAEKAKTTNATAQP